MPWFNFFTLSILFIWTIEGMRCWTLTPEWHQTQYDIIPKEYCKKAFRHGPLVWVLLIWYIIYLRFFNN